MKQPFVSIVVPLHNEARYLSVCVQALLKQTYPADSYEIILVDDASTDESPSICRHFVEAQSGQRPSLRWVRLRRGGLSVGRNAGLAVARGDIVAYLDGDAWAAPTWLEYLVTGFADPLTVVVGGRVAVLNEESDFARFIYQAHYLAQTGESGVIGTNMAFRRQLFAEVGGFFHVFGRRGDETAFFLKVPANQKITVVTQAIVRHEHPARFMVWLKERFYNGRYLLGNEKILTRGRRTATHWRRGALRGATLTSLPLLLMACIWPWLWLLTAVPLSLLAIRFTHRRYMQAVKRLATQQGLLSAMQTLIISWAGLVAEDIGYLQALGNGRPLDLTDSLSQAQAYILETIPPLSNLP